MTEDLRVVFGSEGELEGFLRDADVAPFRRRAIRLPSLAPGETVLAGLSPKEARVARRAAKRHGGLARC